MCLDSGASAEKKMQQMPWEDDPLKHIKIHGKAWAAGLLALVLICLYPCIFLYSQNAGEAELRDILPFFCIFLASAAVILGVCGLVFRNMSRAAFMTGLLMLVVINFTMVSEALKTALPWFRDRYQLAVLAAVFLLLTALLLWKKPNLTAGCGIMALTFGVLLMISGINAVPKLLSVAFYERQMHGPGPEAQVPEFKGEKRDVYYLLFDEYGGEENLQTYFQYDNREFDQALTERGFSVSRTSRNTESCWTDTIIPNLLNMDYVVDDDMPTEARRQYLQDPSLVRLFRGNGYQVNLVNHWNYLRFPGKELTSGQHEASISTYLLQNSMFYQVRPIREKIELRIFLNYRDNYVGPVKNALSALKSCADATNGPTLTVSYIQCPHAPFVFHADGSVQEDKGMYWYWKDESLYPQQLQYINSVILATVDDIQKKDPGAVILLLSDHGARVPLHMVEQFGGPRFDSEKETPVMQNALLAVYVPERQIAVEGMTGINAERTVINQVFGLDMPEVAPAEGYVLPDYFNARPNPDARPEPTESAMPKPHKREKPAPKHGDRPGKDHGGGKKPPKTGHQP